MKKKDIIHWEWNNQWRSLTLLWMELAIVACLYSFKSQYLEEEPFCLTSTGQVLQWMFGKRSRTFRYVLHPLMWMECGTKDSPKVNSFSFLKQWWPSCEEESHNNPLLEMTHHCATLGLSCQCSHFSVISEISFHFLPHPLRCYLSSYWHKRACFCAVTSVSL